MMVVKQCNNIGYQSGPNGSLLSPPHYTPLVLNRTRSAPSPTVANINIILCSCAKYGHVSTFAETDHRRRVYLFFTSRQPFFFSFKCPLSDAFQFLYCHTQSSDTFQTRVIGRDQRTILITIPAHVQTNSMRHTILVVLQVYALGLDARTNAIC